MTYYLYCEHGSSDTLPKWSVDDSDPKDLNESPLKSYDAEVDDSRTNSMMTVIFMQVDPDIEGLCVICEVDRVNSEPLIIHLEDGE